MELDTNYKKLRYEQYFIDTSGDVNHTGKARFQIEYKSINYVYNGFLTHANYCVYFDEKRNVIQVHFEGTKDVPDWITNVLFQPKYYESFMWEGKKITLKVHKSWGSMYKVMKDFVRKEFPHALILRMDADSTKKQEDYESILSRFSNREADVLIGTQMIVKGHDFKGVTLVGIIAADMALNAEDYRAGERAFQQLVQASGRAGRGDNPGEVVIQTYQPDHYAVTYAKTQDYEAFYEDEIKYREAMMYPPVGNLLGVQITGEEERRVVKLSKVISDMIDRMDIREEIGKIGPANASLSKKCDIYRRVIYIKSLNYDNLIKIKDYIEKETEKFNLEKESVMFDFNPMNGF